MRTAILAAALTLAAGCALAQSVAPEPGQVFRRLDANADGAVTLEEWVAQGVPADGFAKVDANGDAKVTLEELAAAIAASAK